MANSWIKGNSPKEAGTYFITVYRNGDYYVPWEVYNYNGSKWSRESKYQQDLDKKRVLAYMKASVPMPFVPDNSAEDKKDFYYVRVDYGNGHISEYGRGSWPKGTDYQNGYETVQKARSALHRRKKMDAYYGYFDLKYSVVDGFGNVIEKKRGKNEQS